MLSRIYQKIFGVDAGTDQLGVIGSAAAGSPATTTDPTVMQSLSNYLEGWYSVVLGANSPAIQDMNALHFLITRQLAYLFEAGIAEWDSETEYGINSLVMSGGVIYKSIQDPNINQAVGDTSYWIPVVGALRRVNVTGAITLGPNTDIVRADMTSGPYTIECPPALEWLNQKITFKCISGTANQLTIDGNGLSIDGGGDLVIEDNVKTFVTLFNNNGTSIDIVG